MYANKTSAEKDRKAGREFIAHLTECLDASHEKTKGRISAICDVLKDVVLKDPKPWVDKIAEEMAFLKERADDNDATLIVGIFASIGMGAVMEVVRRANESHG